MISQGNHVVTLLINCDVIASINALCQVLQMFLYHSTMYNIFRLYYLNTHRTSKWSCLFGFSGGWLQLDQISFGLTPIQKSTLELTWMVSSSISGLICIGQICGGLNRVILHCIPQGNDVHTWHDVKADPEAHLNIIVTGKDVILLQCKMLVPPWELVLELCLGKMAASMSSLEPTVCGINASWPGHVWVEWFEPIWQWIRHAFQSTFSQIVYQ